MYDNIQKAMSTTQPGTLSYEDQAQNYAIFSDLMKKGVKLQDLIDKANAPKEPAMDATLFEVMESAVSDVPEVKSAKKAQDSAMKCVIMKICQNDPDFIQANKEYRDAVLKAYTAKKEKSDKRESRGTKDGSNQPPEQANNCESGKHISDK